MCYSLQHNQRRSLQKPIIHSRFRKVHTLLCGGDALDFNSKYPNRNRTHKAEIPTTSPNRAVCKSRGDAWAAEVKSWCTEFVAAEAEYCRQCRQNFYRNRSKPIKSKSDKKKAGRQRGRSLKSIRSWCILSLSQQVFFTDMADSILSDA